MTRDEEGGRYVNLIATEETDDFNVAYQVADDFYRRVAYRVWEHGGPLEHPFDRKRVKQPSMSYFYGARAGGFQKDRAGRWKPYGMTKQVIDAGSPTKHAKQLAQRHLQLHRGHAATAERGARLARAPRQRGCKEG